MKTSSLITIAFMAGAVSAEKRKWVGLSTSFTSESMWTGGNPLGPDAPKSIVVGSDGDTTITQIPKDTSTLKMGSKLQFAGNTKVILGDGSSSSSVVLSFQASTSNNAQVGVFAPSSLTDLDGPVAGGFDYNCALNWKYDNGSIPSTAPCVDDMVEFPADGSYFISTFNKISAAYSMNIAPPLSGDPRIICPNSFVGNTWAVIDNVPVVMNIDNCNKNFWFGKSSTSKPRNWKGGDPRCPKSSCAPNVEAKDNNGNTIVIFAKGSNKGKAFIKDPTTGLLTSTPIQTKKDQDGNDVYSYGNGVIEVGANGKQITKSPTKIPTNSPTTTMPTKAPTKSPVLSPAGLPTSADASSSDAAAAGITTVIVVVAIVALIIIIAIVVAVVVIRKKTGGKAGDPDRNVVSFENPMYDDVNAEPIVGGEQPSDGLYDDPEMANNSSNGYMDVPANGGVTDSSGYMDVAPGNNDDDDDDDFEDDDDENDDI